MKHGPELGFDDDGKPVLITSVAPSFEQQHRERVRKYLTLMAFRVPALVLAALAYGLWHNGWISLLILVGSIPLPWIAVLIANDRPPRSAEERRRYDATSVHTPVSPTAAHPVLEHRSDPGDTAGGPPGETPGGTPHGTGS